MHSNVDDRRRIEQTESIIRGLGWGAKGSDCKNQCTLPLLSTGRP